MSAHNVQLASHQGSRQEDEKGPKFANSHGSYHVPIILKQRAGENGGMTLEHSVTGPVMFDIVSRIRSRTGAGFLPHYPWCLLAKLLLPIPTTVGSAGLKVA